jgi:hypothetical protein
MLNKVMIPEQRRQFESALMVRILSGEFQNSWIDRFLKGPLPGLPAGRFLALRAIVVMAVAFGVVASAFYIEAAMPNIAVRETQSRLSALSAAGNATGRPLMRAILIE